MDAQSEPAPSLDLSFVTKLRPAQLRAALPRLLSGFLADPEKAELTRVRLDAVVDAWSDETCGDVVAQLGALGRDHRPYPAQPHCRILARVWCECVLTEGRVDGVEHLRTAAAEGPVLICCNHLSYFDTSATDAVLVASGNADLADRLMAAAGPKVYQDLFRVIAAASLNTLPVPQSTSFNHTEKLPARELARKATESLAAAGAAAAAGYLLLLYPEGSRSRSGHLGPFLRGVHRYLACVPDVRVVPAAIAGTEAVMPVGLTQVHPGPVRLRFGPALRLGVDGNGRDLLAAAHASVASMLPPHLAPEPGTPPTA